MDEKWRNEHQLLVERAKQRQESKPLASDGEPYEMELLLAADVGNRIRRHRIAMGLKQVDVVEFLPVSRSTFVNWELGKHVPRLIYLYQLAVLLGCEVTDLFPSEIEVV